MEVQQLVQFLDQPTKSLDWLESIGVENSERAHANLVAMAEAGMTVDLLAIICTQLKECLPSVSDADMALNNLERFVKTARSPLSLGALFDRDPSSLSTLLQLFSTSQYLSDLLVRDPESYDLLRLTEGQPVARDVLVDEISSEVDYVTDRLAVIELLRRYKRRETLRIAYGDIIRGQPIGVVTKQISFLADAVCEAAVRACSRQLEQRNGVPRRLDGQRARFVALGLGKLGGTELNYSSDIDLMFVYEGEGKTDGDRSISSQEFFERLARDIARVLSEPTELGIAYRVDLRLRPEGSQGAAAISMESALHYYDVMGRTWERQAFVKARPVAGDLDFGRSFLAQLEPWIYRRYLNRADITGIKALKRRIERRAKLAEGDGHNVKTGHGGIRDIEFVIQFLQLLNGGDRADVRSGNTLDAIARLESAGCLTFQERTILEENYAFLRKLEHRLQIMFDLQTHTLPDEDIERRRLAVRMGYAGTSQQTALDAFEADLEKTSGLNRKILDHLLHDAFGDEGETQPEVDLVLDPDPTEKMVQQVLARYQFKDVQDAYRNLQALSSEKIPFLSTRRCRHFLASIAPRLLPEIAQTPDPDSTLVNLARVSDSLGGKGVLWELFSFNPPSLNLYVRLCASSPYLSGILTSSPGMIDELLDSLLLDRLPTLSFLDRSLAELCRGAEDLDPILHSFKNSNHLRVGVRDILGKDDIQSTHLALSDIAEVCLNHITRHEYEQLVERYGEPTIHGGRWDGKVCELVVLAMGKLGGREPNYHSDLDVIFLFESDGMTRHRRSDKSTTNQHFFSQLGQRIITMVNNMGPYGRLYELDPRLRPTGKSGSLAVSLDELARYFSDRRGQLWERQSLCKARPVYGSDNAREKSMGVVRHAIVGQPWQASDADEIRHMRGRMEETASKGNLKRGLGGTVDIEFIAQMLQMKHASSTPAVLTPGTLDALDILNQCGALQKNDYEYLSHAYRFLRGVEARLRLMNTTARHDMPQDEDEVKKLAFLLNCESPAHFVSEVQKCIQENRRRFVTIFDKVSRMPVK